MMKILLNISFLFASLNCIGQTSKLEIKVDERMELITTVQYLSNYYLLTKAEISYKNDINTFFKPFKDHNVIKLNRVIQKDFFSFSRVPWYIYQFSFPDFKPISKFTDTENQIEDYEKHIDTLELFKKELKDFYIKSNFHKFFLSHKQYYRKITQPVQKYIYSFNLTDILETHYGEKKKKYVIVLSPLMHDGGFGAEVNTKNGQEIYAFIGPKYNSKAFPVFDTKNILQEYVIHEFSHSFCNPIINKNYKLFEKYKCLEDTIASQMDKQGYGDDWGTCLYEHLVRANEIVLTNQILGKSASLKLYKTYFDERNWIYLKGIVPLIANKYLLDRKKYKTQYQLIDDLKNYFENEKKQNCH